MAEAKPAKGQWFFEVSEGRLRLVDPAGSEQVFSPADVPNKVDLAVMLFGRPLLALKGPPELLLKIPPTLLGAMVRWMGPPTFARLAVTQGRIIPLKFGIPFGLFFAFAAIFFGPRDAASQSSTVDVVGLLTAVMFVAYGLVGRLSPSLALSMRAR